MSRVYAPTDDTTLELIDQAAKEKGISRGSMGKLCNRICLTPGKRG